MKARRDLDAVAVLRHLAELSLDHRHDGSLIDAWPLAWKGWVDIDCTIRCNSNWLPPQTTYRITLTDKGRAVLDAAPRAA
jgi:hypothetical protein